MPDNAPRIAPLDPERIIATLGRHDVKYVHIGAAAARLQGFPRMTADADITPARDPDNLQRLAPALRALASAGADVRAIACTGDRCLAPASDPADWSVRLRSLVPANGANGVE